MDARQAELLGLKVGLLRQRAKQAGADMDRFSEAVDEEDKPTMVKLILAAEAQAAKATEEGDPAKLCVPLLRAAAALDVKFKNGDDSVLQETVRLYKEGLQLLEQAVSMGSYSDKVKEALRKKASAAQSRLSAAQSRLDFLQQEADRAVRVAAEAAAAEPEPEPKPAEEGVPPEDESAKMSCTTSTAPVDHWSEAPVLSIEMVEKDVLGKPIEVHNGDDGVWEKPGRRWPQTERFPATLVSVDLFSRNVSVRYNDNPTDLCTHAPKATTITLQSTGQRLGFNLDCEEVVSVGGAVLGGRSTSAGEEGLGFKGSKSPRGAAYYAQGSAPQQARASQVNPRDEGFGGKHDTKKEEASLYKRR